MSAEIGGHPWIRRLTRLYVRPSSLAYLDTPVAELVTWWLNSVARHQVRTSTFDSYQRFGRYLADAIGDLRVVDVDAETLIEWQSNQLDKHAPLTVLNSRKVGRPARSGVYPSTGTALGPTKTSSAGGVHFLAPVSVEHLRRRRDQQEADRRRADAAWPTHRYDGQNLSMVFTTAAGELSNRQAVLQTIERAAKAADIDPTALGTHSGRRTVITALYADGGVDLADIARHVGHVDTATTAEYVRSLGNRPIDTGCRAAALLDPTMNGGSSSMTL